MLKNEKLMEENRENSRTKVKDAGWDKTVFSFLQNYSKAIEGFRQVDVNTLKAKVQHYELLTNKVNEQLRMQRDALFNSLSWKLTEPMRAIATFFKRR
jgi:hypothetical protein